MERINKFTKSSSCLLSESDADDIYLAWDDMEFENVGTISEELVPVEDICKDQDYMTRVLFPGFIIKYRNTFNEIPATLNPHF